MAGDIVGRWRGVVLVTLALVLMLLSACGSSSAQSAPQHPGATATTMLSTPTCASDGCGSQQGIRGVQVFVEPEAGATPVTSAIKGATRSVWVEVYLLTDSRVIAALEDAEHRGVDVRVMIEEHPYGGDVVSPQRTLQTLQTAGINAKFADPAYYYTHAKMLIIDGATLYVLTANLTRSGLGGSSVARNREFGVIDTHADEVAEAMAIFQADWNRTQPTLHDSNMVVSPVNSRATITALFTQTRTSLLIEDEEMYDSASEDALIAAAKRGVDVRLILPGATDIEAADAARLKAGGVHLVYVSAPYIHAKAIVSDGRLAFIGSENFSETSLDQNREVGLLLADSTALAIITSTFERDWAVGQPA
ncbi:MAG TPA: phospholipase D-like domain-containing protein [Ktedonobacterales bacterium]|nr:phospholipase D-like domain-containing protein [Ktedonobacterales bacterium]